MIKITKDKSIVDYYNSMKKSHSQALILFKHDDRYECYSEDAVKVSSILETTMYPVDNDLKIVSTFAQDMLEECLVRLIRAGQRVAICSGFNAL